MENLLYLVLGWLFGLLTLGVSERIRREYRKREVVASIIGELADLQFVIATAAYRIRMHLAEETDEFLDWFIPIVREYDGPSKEPQMLDTLLTVRRMPEDRRHAVHVGQRGENTEVRAVKYYLPGLAAQSSDLPICPLEFQRRVLWVRQQLEYFNEGVDFVQSQFQKTFDPAVVGENRASLEANITSAHRGLANRAMSIAKAITDMRAPKALEKS